MSLLPLPTKDYGIPKILNENIDAGGTVLCNKIDYIFETIEDETINLQDLHDIDKCPDKYLNYLGYTFAADLQDNDTSLQKRIKILNAIETHKKRFTWTDDYKQKIYLITGVYPDLYNFFHVLAIGVGGVGIKGYRQGAYGVIYNDPTLYNCIFIDTHIVPGMAIYDQIDVLLKNDLPAYLVIKIGYISSGNYITVLTY
jgi:hypothetical protein